MTLKKKVVVFVCAYLIAGMIGCTPVISTGVRTVEWWESKLSGPKPTTRPWHFESDVVDGKVYPRVVYDDVPKE